MSVQEVIDQKKQRGERFGNTYVVTEEDTKNLRAARFVAEDGAEAASPAAPAGIVNLERPLDDIVKDGRKQRAAEQKAKKAEQQKKKQAQQPKQNQNQRQPPAQPRQQNQRQPQQNQRQPQQNQRQQQQQQPQPRGQQQNRRQSASTGHATQRPQAQKAQPRGRQNNQRFDDSENVSRMRSRHQQQQQKQKKQEKTTDFLAMIDPAEAAARQSRADRFKTQ